MQRNVSVESESKVSNATRLRWANPYRSAKERATANNELAFAIKNNDLNATEAFFKKSIFLFNNTGIAEGCTALTLAAKYKANDILEFLLSSPEMREMLGEQGFYYQDSNNKSLFDYEDKNLYLALLSQAQDTVINTNFIDAIEKSLSEANDPTLTTILLLLKDYCHVLHKENFYLGKGADLYFTLQHVYKIASGQSQTLAQDISQFLQLRARVLKGDSHDYCYSQTQANTFCSWLAKSVFPNEENPANIIYQQALTAARDCRWMNAETNGYSLPESPFDYFRTEENYIHLYLPIVERAIARVKAGHTELKNIWLGSDIKMIEAKVQGSQESKKLPALPLNPTDIKTLERRTPTLAKLVEYTHTLEVMGSDELAEVKQESKSNAPVSRLSSRFTRLRAALLQGDYKHNGSEYVASAEANIEIANFSEWWNTLSKTPDGIKLQERLKRIEKLDKVLTIILDDGNVNKRNDSIYCIKIKGDMLDDVLSNEKVLQELLAIEGKINYRVAHVQLDEWHKLIVAELQQVPAQLVKKNIFKELALHNSEFIKYCHAHNKLDFTILENLQHVLSITSFLQKDPLTHTMEPAKRRAHIHSILCISNPDHLDFLMKHMLKASEYVLQCAIVIRYEILKEQGCQFATTLAESLEQKSQEFWLNVINRVNDEYVLDIFYAAFAHLNIPTISHLIMRSNDYVIFTETSSKISFWERALKSKHFELMALLYSEENKAAMSVKLLDFIRVQENTNALTFIFNYLKLVGFDTVTQDVQAEIFALAIKNKYLAFVEYLVSINFQLIDVSLNFLLGSDFPTEWVPVIKKLLDLQRIAEITFHVSAAISTAVQWDVLLYWIDKFPETTSNAQVWDELILYAIKMKNLFAVQHLKNKVKITSQHLKQALLSGEETIISIMNNPNIKAENETQVQVLAGIDAWQAVNAYYAIAKPYPWTLTKLLDLALEKSLVKEIVTLIKLDAKPSIQNKRGFELLFTKFYKQNTVTEAIQLVEGGLVDKTREIFLTAKKDSQWEFIITYLLHFKKFNFAYLQKLMIAALQCRQETAVSAILQLDFTSNTVVLAAALANQMTNSIPALINPGHQKGNEAQLLSELRKGNTICMKPYLQATTCTQETLDELLVIAITSDASAELIVMLLEKGAVPNKSQHLHYQLLWDKLSQLLTVDNVQSQAIALLKYKCISANQIFLIQTDKNEVQWKFFEKCLIEVDHANFSRHKFLENMLGLVIRANKANLLSLLLIKFAVQPQPSFIKLALKHDANEVLACILKYEITCQASIEESLLSAAERGYWNSVDTFLKLRTVTPETSISLEKTREIQRLDNVSQHWHGVPGIAYKKILQIFQEELDIALKPFSVTYKMISSVLLDCEENVMDKRNCILRLLGCVMTLHKTSLKSNFLFYKQETDPNHPLYKLSYAFLQRLETEGMLVRNFYKSLQDKSLLEIYEQSWGEESRASLSSLCKAVTI